MAAWKTKQYGKRINVASISMTHVLLLLFISLFPTVVVKSYENLHDNSRAGRGMVDRATLSPAHQQDPLTPVPVH